MAQRVASCHEYFETLNQRFIPDKAGGVDATYLFRLAGDGGGTWTVTVKDKTLSTTPAAVDNPSVTLEMNAKDYVDMANGDLSGIKAVFTRKLKVSGSIPLAKKMNDFLPPNK
jgi:putative sterol carrier protein